MTDKPRVTAQHHIEAHTDQRICDEFGTTTPDVLVSVSFDLHDHEAALSALTTAVVNVRSQIEQTMPDPKPRIVSICNDSDNHRAGCDCARKRRDTSARAMLDGKG